MFACHAPLTSCNPTHTKSPLAPPPKHLLAESISAFFLGDLLCRLYKIIRNLVAHDTVLVVRRMSIYEMSDPLGRRPVRAVGPLPDEVKVCGNVAARLNVDIHTVEIRFDKRDKTGEATFGGLLTVDDFVDSHLFVFVLHRPNRRGWSARRRRRGAGARACFVYGERILTEPELFRRYGVTDVRSLHVFRHSCDWDVEVQIERQNGSRDEHNEDAERRVLEVCDLNLHWSELDTPTNIGPWWWWFEAHVLPVRRLQILKVVRFRKIEFFEIFVEDYYWVADEQMSKVRG
jgi:hypothetical protein